MVKMQGWGIWHACRLSAAALLDALGGELMMRALSLETVGAGKQFGAFPRPG